MPYEHLKTCPFKVPYYDVTDEELEHFFLFCACVPGKSAAQIAKKVDQFLGLLKQDATTEELKTSPLHTLWTLSFEAIRLRLMQVRMGRYSVLTQCLGCVSRAGGAFFLRTCNISNLEAIPGIGPKTARFFLTYTQRSFRGAILDTHILKWMREHHKQLNLKKSEIPMQTPSSKSKYRKLEAAYLTYCEQNQRKPAELDFEIWESRARKAA